VFHGHAFIMVAALSAASVVNLLYIRYLGSHLSDSALGIFFSAQTLLMMFGAGGAAVQMAVAGGTAHLHALHGRGPVGPFALVWFRRMGFASGAILVLFAVVSVPASSILHFNSAVCFLAVGVALAFYAFVPVLLGVSQGLQSFWILAAIYLTDVGARLGSAWLLDGAGLLNASGAVVTLDLAFFTVVAIFAPLLFFRLRASRSGAEGEESTPRDLLPAALGLISLSIFAYLDVLVVQVCFGAADGGEGLAALGRGSGVYGAASYIGRSFILITLPLVTVVYPKARTGRTLGKNTFGLLARTLISVGVVCLPLAAGCYFFAEEVSRILFPRLAAAPLLREYTPAILPYVFLTVLVHYNLAVRQTWISWVLLPAIALQATAYFFFHGSHQEVIRVLGFTGLGLCIPVLLVTLVQSLRYGRGGEVESRGDPMLKNGDR
jgi:O-antigen/teichoic acid export membrane protein